VLDIEGYHLDLLVIYLFRGKKTYLRIVTDCYEIGKHGIVEKLPYERWVVYLLFGLMAAVFVLH
jgi:hypothetical protein